MGYTLYRMYDTTGALLYVGATVNPAVRFTQHSRDKPWWEDVATIAVEHFSSLEELRDAEVAAIESESPRHNLIPCTFAPWAMKPRRAKGQGSIFRRADGFWIGRVEVPSTDGKRRYRQVSSKSRSEVELRFAALKAELGMPA